MIKQFEKLPATDQRKILSACIAEFGEKGYERASTNTMVKNAGIPKGTLFYFFGNKKQLFLYLVDHAVGKYVEYVNQYLEDFPADLFERLLFMAEVRLRFAAHAPYLYRFFFKTLLNIPDELKIEMQERFKEYADGNKNLMSDDLDTTELRDGITVDQVMELLSYIMDGLLSRHTDRLMQLDAAETIDYVEQLLEQSRNRFDLIKHGVYKS
jgi:TetR/AcrR family transcriptional regulator